MSEHEPFLSILSIFGLNTPLLLAGSCFGAREVMGNILVPARFDDQPATEKLRIRSITVHLWQECGAEIRENRDDVTTNGETGLKGKRSKLLDVFRARYGFLPSLDNQPSEACLGLLAKMHANRPTEFFRLAGFRTMRTAET